MAHCEAGEWPCESTKVFIYKHSLH